MKDSDINIKDTLLKIKDVCNTFLLHQKLKEIDSVKFNAIDIKNVIKKVAYSPNTDVVYIYIQGVETSSLLVQHLMDVFKKNSIYVEVDMQRVNDVGVIELDFGDKKMINYFKNNKMSKIVTL